MMSSNKTITLLVTAMLALAGASMAEDMLIEGGGGYQPPDYLLPVPPALKIMRGPNASGLDIVSDPAIGGEYMQRWLIPSIPSGEPWAVGYVNSGGHVYFSTSLTIAGRSKNCPHDINCRIQEPYIPYMIGAWSDLGPDGFGIVSRANSTGGPPYGALDRYGNVTTRIEEKGTISLKPQVVDAEALEGYGRIFAKDLGDNVYGLFWRDPTGAVRRIDNCPQ